jgi:NAD dependent epimerase/dehydratase
LILVTGADGFIGSHLTEMLHQAGHEVRALVYYNAFDSWGWLDEYGQRDELDVVVGDVRDPSLCRSICKDVDTVLHLAALIGIPYSYVAPDSYVDTNISGTLNMLQAARDVGVGKFIHTSTSEVYGTAKYVPIDEAHEFQPQSPYSATKIAADALARSYHASFEFPVVVARPFNTYGPRQSMRAVIPTIISQILSGAREIKVGDLSPTRDFNFVTDTCRAFIALMESDAAIGKEVNMASNSEISIGDTFQLIAHLLDADVEFTVDEARLRPKGSEVFRLFGDASLLESLTGHKHEVSIEQGLAKTITWFQSRADQLDKTARYTI